ncbi:hypothetical protein Leryth_015915 [Lithospermum erythrorhizon]|nr:hypothetical protein Leryth_015915 [Lithospermum erythrorhizon]
MALTRVHTFPANMLKNMTNLVHFEYVSAECRRKMKLIASFHSQESTYSHIEPTKSQHQGKKVKRWKPMCLYYTHGMCTKGDDFAHLEMFNHNKCELEDDLEWKSQRKELGKVREQKFDYFLVLDLEGKVEILEFPVLLFDVKSMNVVDFFHRFVRPSKMSESRINEYIEGKYGKLGVDGVWHDTAIPFEEVIQQFENWMESHQLWRKGSGGPLSKSAFVTCGNWDVKTKIPDQCKLSMVNLPSYFMEWINLKDIFLNFYKRRAPGMLSMMRELQMPMLGSHHLGIDDTRNLSRVLRHMLNDGALLEITARRNRESFSKVMYQFTNRV